MRSAYRAGSRSGWFTISGAALRLTHSACPAGCLGAGRKPSNRPSWTIAAAPHRDTHSGPKVTVSAAPPILHPFVPGALPPCSTPTPWWREPNPAVHDRTTTTKSVIGQVTQ